MESFDAIVIGCGQSGPPLAVRLAKAGRRVALIEREHLGGTCVNDGCIPTKTLVASARVAHLARRATDFGVMLPGPITVDMAAVKARKDGVVQASVTSLTQWLTQTPNLELIWGDASFAGPHEVKVGDRVLQADQIFLDVGGHPVVPEWPGLSETAYLTNTSMMSLDVLPEHLIIVGGSYIGLEFAQMYRRFGARVTVVEQGPRIISREDPDVSEAVAAVLLAEGITLHTGASQIGVQQTADGTVLTASSPSGPISLCGSHLLLAIGRVPNTRHLGLDKAGVAVDKRGFITVNDKLETSAPGIWALGDVNGRGAFTHTSYNDFEIVSANLLDGEDRKVSDRILAYALFIDPPLARIGQSKTALREAGRDILVGRMPMTRVGRARERGETSGFMEVLIDPATRLIVGATLFCIEADEVIHALLDVMYAKAPYTVIQRAVHIHPTVSELIPTLLADLKALLP